VRRLAVAGLVVAALWFARPLAAHAEESAAPSAHEAAASAHEASGEAEHEQPASVSPVKLGLQFLNFGVLVFILGFFGGKAVNKALLQRHEQLKADLVAAADERAAAEGRAKLQEQRLATLELEIEAIRAGIRGEAESEKARLIALAEERAKRIQEETKFLLDQQVKEAEAQLRREVAEAAVKIAEQIVIRSLDARDQKRLLDTFVEDIAKASAPGRAV
jgi:F-type H+-transporting ATPase subunit b